MDQTTEDVFTLGTSLGRKQALGLIAGRCTAAEIECLINAEFSRLQSMDLDAERRLKLLIAVEAGLADLSRIQSSTAL